MTNASDRLFIDTSYLIARFNRFDQYHDCAVALDNVIHRARELWTTDAILLEFAAAFGSPGQRGHVVSVWDRFHAGEEYRTSDCSFDHLNSAMDLYRSRDDKAWSLADCLSFVVMEQQELTDALTAD